MQLSLPAFLQSLAAICERNGGLVPEGLVRALQEAQTPPAAPKKEVPTATLHARGVVKKKLYGKTAH